jgi:hypothetical protein
MEFAHITFRGLAIDDTDVLDRVPSELGNLLRQLNGFIQFHGGFHVRGACHEPWWHSLRAAWEGDEAFHRLYPQVRAEDVPFAEDCLGDQFLLRGSGVVRLRAETGESELLGLSFGAFLDRVQKDPVEILTLGPLQRFRDEGGRLEPGQSLGAYPPFCTKEAAAGVHLAAIPTRERRRFLAAFAARLRGGTEPG